MQNINQIMSADNLVQLVQKDNFIGWIYSLDYDQAKVMTNDLWKAQVQGVPLNSFLVAATFNPDNFSRVLPQEREVLLLRVIGAAHLPQDDDMIRTKIDYYQQQTELYTNQNRDYDDITRNMMQFSSLACRVLGTFYTRDGELWMGSDLESFSSATRFGVYRPRSEALTTIVNYVDPIRKQRAVEEAKELGLAKVVAPFKTGTVRYTSTDRLHRGNEETKVAVHIQPSDFLARRTAVLGMTRTGKSNMVKQMVSVVKRVADEGGLKIGQIIYDLNGEYANANQQDKGAIADIYDNGETIRYRMLSTPGFEELQNNFYLQLNEGFAIIRKLMYEKKQTTQADMDVFLNTSFDEPDSSDRSAYSRWQVRSAAYQALLYQAGFNAPSGHKVRFQANTGVRAAVNEMSSSTLKDPKDGLTLQEAVDWFLAARMANAGAKNLLRSGAKSQKKTIPNVIDFSNETDEIDETDSSDTTSRKSSGKPWLDNDTRSILNLLAKLNDSDSYIRGYSNLSDAHEFHSPRRSKEVGDEIYQHLFNGKIVILDLSVGNPELRERISKQIAADIFNKSMNIFVKGKTPPHIVVYVEEAHNLLGKGMDLTDTWPRLAKEGAKYRIALVYATQEVSSVHPNILSNTENWFITHLNNQGEIKELAKFYDFDDFSRSLLRAQDVGFARVKTLSSPFVIPTQIDKFDPETERRRVEYLRQQLSQSKAVNGTAHQAVLIDLGVR